MSDEIKPITAPPPAQKRPEETVSPVVAKTPQEPSKTAAPPVVDGAADTAAGGPPPPAKKKHVPKYPLEVAPGKAITCRRGVLGPGEEVRATDFPADSLNDLIDKGYVLKNGK